SNIYSNIYELDILKSHLRFDATCLIIFFEADPVPGGNRVIGSSFVCDDKETMMPFIVVRPETGLEILLAKVTVGQNRVPALYEFDAPRFKQSVYLLRSTFVASEMKIHLIQGVSKFT
ncbi:hypothetical protein M378DRAFT_1038471, partial [Amanita muscaria Koide BX008]